MIIKKNLSMAWIDYRKAYDSVSHGWIKTLQMYRFNEKLIKFMEASMSNWKTTLKLFYNDGCITTDQIKIKRGIFQGNSFSPLQFSLTGYIWIWYILHTLFIPEAKNKKTKQNKRKVLLENEVKRLTPYKSSLKCINYAIPHPHPLSAP